MKVLKKQISAAITLVLMFSMAISLLASVQIAKAVDINTWVYLTVYPDPVGVGQPAYVTVWLDRYPPSHPTGPGGYVMDATWDFTVKITDPSGNVQTKNLKSDFIGGASFNFVPATIGTYAFDVTFEENTQTSNTYLSSTYHTVDLVVQEEPIPTYPTAPLPTEYWTRPIDSQNREWNVLLNNWYGPSLYGGTYSSGNNWVRTGSAPNSAHILWTREIELGGVVGDWFGSEGYYGGLSYESKWSPVIIDGRLFYNKRLGSSSYLGVSCVDMDTGEELWFKKDISVDFGQVLAFESRNQHGAIPYLWDVGSTYRLYDPFTGEHILNIENASTGSYTLDEKGNLLVYVLSGSQNRLTLWNSTQCILRGQPPPGVGGFGVGDPDYWRPNLAYWYNWPDGIMWNVSVPDVPGSQSIATIGDSVLVAGARAESPDIIGMTGYSMETGAQLWNFNVTSTESQVYFQTAEVDGKFAWFRQETMEWYGYNALTGAQIWGPTEPYEDPWGMFTSGGGGIGASSPVIAYGKLYAVGYDGMIHCFDMDTGENLWNYYIGDAGFETPYGTWALAMGEHVAADGKIYASCGEHSPSQPLWRGQKLVCVNATTGEEIWRTLGWLQDPIIADGAVVSFNLYDNRIYCFRKGPSAITVSPGPKTATLGDKVVIDGMVTDIAAGTKEHEQAARFPNGLPAISDDYMDPWMAYVYMNQPLPTDAEGVEVWIDVIDANGNYRNIGTTTSDLSGFYHFTWEPDIPGDYKVIATFAGTESYWPSYSETAFTVMEPPAATPGPTPTPASVADMYFLPVSIGMIVAIIIVLVLLVILLLRKR